MVVQLQNDAKAILMRSDLSFGDSPSISNMGLYRRFGKRALDLTLTLLTAPIVFVLLLPLIACVATDGKNPFYTQMRIGRGGRHYRMWKLRTMVVDADKKLAAYLEKNPEAAEEWNRSQKLKCDPRITKIGRILRKTSADELPQLWNVLRGDMSLIGPRPMMVDQQKLYPGNDYYDLRPGITGSWQVSSRNESSFADRAGFDATYNADLSLGEDVRILVKTVSVVLKATGY